MPDFSVLIPHDPGDPHRDALIAWTSAYWRSRLPEAEVIVAGVGASPPNRSANRNLLAARATTDLLVFLDADTLSTSAAVRAGAELARIEALVKYAGVHWVNARSTKALLQTDPIAELCLGPDNVQSDSAILWGLGFFMRRETLEAVGGWDERFVGWGHEDPSLTMAVTTLVGPMVRIADWAFHLWHPRQTEGGEHDKTSAGFLANRARGLAYREAEGKPEVMRALIGLPETKA